MSRKTRGEGGPTTYKKKKINKNLDPNQKNKERILVWFDQAFV